jgi:hypothetical protein
MKRRIIAIATVAILGMSTFVACNKVNEVPESTKGQQKMEIKSSSTNEDSYTVLFNNIGIIHNDVMNFVFQKFKENNNFKNIDSTNAAKLFSSYVDDYFANYQNVNGQVTDLSLTKKVYQNVLLNSNTDDRSFSQTYLEGKNVILNYLNSNPPPQDFIAYCKTQVEKTLPLLPENEKIAFKSFAIVLGYSNLYWSENLSAWGNEYNSQNGYQTMAAKGKTTQGVKINGTSVAKADAEGAVSGALTGAAGGAVAGGVGAVPGAILGAATGASYGSLTNIVFQLLFSGW